MNEPFISCCSRLSLMVPRATTFTQTAPQGLLTGADEAKPLGEAVRGPKLWNLSQPSRSLWGGTRVLCPVRSWGMANVVIVGSGVVGSATGKGFARAGHNVTFVDISLDRVAALLAEGYN